MEYNVVFDISQSGYRQWPGPAIGLIFVAIGTGLVLFRRRFSAHTPKVVPFLFLGFAVVWKLSTFIITLRDYSGLASAFREGRCEVTEGVVSDFHPMPYSGHENEWFVVDGKRFAYSDYKASAGFNNTASHGGPIHKGVRVRVHHRGNDIAKLEVAR